ncbi:hypothetical protein BDV93DRAFT_526685 [Ceratobasidium sp. AG-I]|nr:hypothetical protein BDV93DRAFT_526685 [Ceratobasidium sp. AG-I]
MHFEVESKKQLRHRREPPRPLNRTKHNTPGRRPQVSAPPTGGPEIHTSVGLSGVVRMPHGRQL